MLISSCLSIKNSLLLFEKYSSQERQALKGFSFVEVIVSLFVLSIGFLGIVNLATATLRHSFLQRDSVVASMLVQEGAELVYNVRDTNLANGYNAFGGDPGISTDNIQTGSYRIDYTSPNFASSCSTFDECRLSSFSAGSDHFFGYGSGGTPTKFSRKIIIEDTSSGGMQSRKVTSVVVWGGSPFPSTVDSNHCGRSISDPPHPTIHCAFAQTELQEN